MSEDYQHINVVFTLNNLYNVMLKTRQTELFTQLKDIQKKKAIAMYIPSIHWILKMFLLNPLTKH